MATPITSLTSNDTFQTWFNTTNTIISTVNGITTSPGGITGPYVISFNGLTGEIVFSNYVSNFNGLTGSISGLTGTIAGNGITITGSSTNPTISNGGVLSVNGASGVIQNIAVTNAAQVFQTLQEFIGGISANGATFSGNISAPNIITTTSTNAFTNVQSFNAGISAAGSTFSGNVTITGSLSAPNIVNSFNGRTGALQGVSAISGTANQITVSGATGAVTVSLPSTISLISQISGPTNLTLIGDSDIPAVLSMRGVLNTVPASTPFSTLTGNLTVSAGLSAASLGISGAATVAGNFRAGTYLGNLVNTINGFTAGVSITAGVGIGITTANKSLTVSNTGVLSFNGLTGAVSGVTTSVANIFAELQTFNQGISANGATFTNSISGTQATFTGNVTAPNILSTSAANTFSAIQSFGAGISASGATFSGPISAPNVVTTSAANTYTALQRFSAGLSASNGIFMGGITVEAGNLGFSISKGNGGAVGCIAIGGSALTSNSSGTSNIAIGNSVLTANTTGANNTGVGDTILATLNSGGNNTGVGGSVLASATTASNSTGIGYLAGGTVTGVTNGVFIGANTTAAGTTSINEIVIGAGATGLGSNTTVIGNTNTRTVKLYGTLNASLGITAPGATFSGRISAAGATFSGDISVNGITLGRGGGNIPANVTIGIDALSSNTSGYNNTAIGYGALQNNTTGNENFAIGYQALQLNNGSYNIALGSQTLYQNVNGTNNIAIGVEALASNNSGNFNTAIGTQSLINNQSGLNNIGIGYVSLFGLETGSDNVAIGDSALAAISSTSRNTVIGSNAVIDKSGLANGVYIGFAANSINNNQTNEIVIGAGATGIGNNSAVIGNSSQQFVRLYGTVNATSGITAPGATFSGLVSVGGLSAAGATFSGIVSLNGQTFTNVVSSINGLTGAVTITSGAATNVTNTFTAQQIFAAGLSASGATFTGSVVSGGTFAFGRVMDTTGNNRVIMNAFKIVSKTGLSAEVARFNKNYYNMIDVTSTVNIIDQNTSQGVWPSGIGPEPVGAPIPTGYYIGRKDLIVHDGVSSEGTDRQTYVTAINLAAHPVSLTWDFGCNINGDDAILFITPFTRQTTIFTGHYTLTPVGLTG
jgi:hypothetical protein